METAKIAAISQIHNCMLNTCGGDARTGKGCRFDFPKRLLKHTVVAMISVSPEQMECRVLSRRTHDRVNNANMEYCTYYWRANHDSTVLVDACHTKRYITKYASKGNKHAEVLFSLFEHLQKRGLDNVPGNLKHVLMQVILADCSHRTFISKMEVAYRIMDLPLIIKTYNNVKVESCYHRALIVPSPDEPDVLVYSDRRAYSAYAERFHNSTVLKSPLTNEHLDAMCFHEFCETVNYRFVKNKKDTSTELEPTKKKSKRRLRTVVLGDGHWFLSARRSRQHVRMSTVLYTDMVPAYSAVQDEETTSQTAFLELPADQRRLLTRCHYEMVNKALRVKRLVIL